MQMQMVDAQTNTTKVFKFKCTFSGTINDVMQRRGWLQVDEHSDDWDVFWCDLNQMRDLYTCKVLEDHQRVGHFRNCQEISRKNLMLKNLKKLRRRIEVSLGREEAKKLDFYPTTFILPTEHKQFVQNHRHTPGAFWIIKPAAGAQGRGIYIFDKLKDYFDWRGNFDSAENQVILHYHQRQLLDQHVRNQVELEKDPNYEPKGFMETLLEPLEPISKPDESYNLQSPESTAEVENSTDEPLPETETPILPPPEPPTPGTDPLGTPKPETVNVVQGASVFAVEPNKSDVYVVQRYISSPYLIGGRKFDIRLFVLVTSYSPLKAWMYREGFARFSRGQFSLKSLRDIYVHLTNVAIQRTSEDYDAEKGSKWSLHNLREYMTARHGAKTVQHLLNQIDTIVVRTLQSAQPQIIQDKHCFELYGFDVIIDSGLRPWLLEVNASPAFTPSNEEDYRLKSALLDDAVHVLDLEGRLLGVEKRVGGFDLFLSDGLVYANPIDCGHVVGAEDGPKLNTFLGCVNDRVTQLRNLFALSKYIKDVQRIQASGGDASSDSGRSTATMDVPIQSFPKPPIKIKDARYRVPD